MSTAAATTDEHVWTTTDGAVARRAFRQVVIGAAVCAVVFGVTAASSALTYVTAFPTELSRHQLAVTTSADTGLAVLLGPVSSVDTVGGYTVYKGFVTITTIGAIWAVLAANRLLRGEEDSGRWQLMLAGSTRASRATGATLGALAAAVGVIFAGTTLLVLLAGRDPDVGFGLGNSLLYGLSIAIAPAVFAAIGGLTSQLCRTRRTANGLALADLRRRVRGPHDRRLRTRDAVAVVGDPVRLDRAHAPVHRQRPLAARAGDDSRARPGRDRDRAGLEA